MGEVVSLNSVSSLFNRRRVSGGQGGEATAEPVVDDWISSQVLFNLDKSWPRSCGVVAFVNTLAPWSVRVRIVAFLSLTVRTHACQKTRTERSYSDGGCGM